MSRPADTVASIPVVRKLHKFLAPGEIPCRSCSRKYPWPASHIASAKRIGDLPPVAWPVCEMHCQHAMVAGWFPIREVTEADFTAAVTKAREGSGS